MFSKISTGQMIKATCRADTREVIATVTGFQVIDCHMANIPADTGRVFNTYDRPLSDRLRLYGTAFHIRLALAIKVV